MVIIPIWTTTPVWNAFSSSTNTLHNASIVASVDEIAFFPIRLTTKEKVIIRLYRSMGVRSH